MSLFNSVWSLGPGSSKIVMIGMNTKEKFHPCLWLSKGGLTPLKLYVSDFKKLVAKEQNISSFFWNSSEDRNLSALELSGTLQVHFDRSFGTKMVTIERQLSGTIKTTCRLTEKNWTQFSQLFQCILYEMNNLIEIYCQMPNLLNTISLHLKNTQAVAVCAAFSKQDTEDIMKQLQRELPLVTDYKFDVTRAVLELTSMCGNYLMTVTKKFMFAQNVVPF